ncbi:MAG TPA: cytochrome c, partial [Acidimicrobiales bacterium]
YTAASSEMEKKEKIPSRATTLLPWTGVASTRWFIITGVASALLGSAALAPAETKRSADVEKGKELFLRYCSGCHGEDGRGEAKTFRPNVGNLAVKELMDQLPDEYLFTVIKNGGAAVGKNAAMPAWQKQLGDQEIWEIVAFVRTLGQR